MNKGWIKVHRKIMDSDRYFDEPFCRNMAWIDLLLLANHKDKFFRIRSIKVEVKTGQVGYSSSQLASRWHWSRGKVIRFLKELQDDNMIVQQNNNVTTLISIINYGMYQFDGTADGTADDTTNSTADGTAKRQQTIQQNGHKTVQQKNSVTDSFTNDNDDAESNSGTANDTANQDAGIEKTDTNKKNKKENNTNKNSGGVPPPPPPVFVVPDKFFVASDLNGLPTDKVDEIIRFFKVVHQKDISQEQIIELWGIFKSQNLTGTKPYLDKNDVYRHFFNVTKKQPFKTERKSRVKKVLDEKVYGVEYVNDFTQCKMSDGSIQDLDENQISMAKFQGLKPSVIIKK